MAFSPDGNYVLTGSEDTTAQVWTTTSGRPVGQTLEHKNGVRGVVFSPDGNLVMTQSGGEDSKTVRLWETASGKPVGPGLEHQSAVRSMAFAPDGKYLLTTSAETVALWKVPSPAPWNGNPERIALSVTVMTGMEVDEHGTIRLLDPATWQQRRDHLDKLGGPIVP